MINGFQASVATGVDTAAPSMMISPYWTRRRLSVPKLLELVGVGVGVGVVIGARRALEEDVEEVEVDEEVDEEVDVLRVVEVEVVVGL
jgi:hypothetical protein